MTSQLAKQAPRPPCHLVATPPPPRTAHHRRADAEAVVIFVAMMSALFHSGDAAHYAFDAGGPEQMQLCPSGEAAASALAEFAEAFNAEATDKVMYDVLQASRASGSM